MEVLDEVSEKLNGSESADQEIVDAAVELGMAKKRAARGQSMVGGPKPHSKTLKTYKFIAGTAPSAVIRQTVFAKPNAREVAGKSVMSSVSFEIGLGVALYSPLAQGQKPRPSLLRDELAEKVSKALGDVQVRRGHRRYCHCPSATAAALIGTLWWWCWRQLYEISRDSHNAPTSPDAGATDPRGAHVQR